jgi:8-oxo-dGTP diphosphatase
MRVLRVFDNAKIMKKYRTLDDVNWNLWEPEERATLLFVICGGKILLIEKKTGLGAGKINGPGGRIEPGETPRECAIRELEEEVCVKPHGVLRVAELSFQFTDGYSLHGTIFTATDCEGEPTETREAVPFWVDLDKIPYERMWLDDIHWLPRVLAGEKVRGWFLFDGENRMMGHKVDTLKDDD